MLPHPELNFRRTPVTLLLAAVIIAIELVCTFDPGRREVYYTGWKLGMLSPVWSGELWRPFTTTLLHGFLIHAAFNVYWLATFGRVLEPYFGSGRYLLVLALLAGSSTMCSFLASNLNTPLDAQATGVGLSGVVYGLFGILWIGQSYRRDFTEVCGPEVVQLFIAWFLFCIVLTYLEVLPVDNIAHGAGCAIGVLYGLALFEPARRWLWRSAAVLVTLVCLGSMVGAPGHPLYEKKRHNEQIRALDEVIRKGAGQAEQEREELSPSQDAQEAE
jgi:membrane associated rhomboid family serine protease